MHVVSDIHLKMFLLTDYSPKLYKMAIKSTMPHDQYMFIYWNPLEYLAMQPTFKLIWCSHVHQ